MGIISKIQAHWLYLRLRNHEEVSPRTIPGPFAIGPFENRTGDPPLHKKRKSPNLLPEGPIASCVSVSLTGS